MNDEARWINGWFCKASVTYPEFLQAKEFEKSYRYAIDGQTNALIANERDLAAASIAVSREQNAILAEINSTVSKGLDEINGTLNWGFAEVIAGIGRLNDQLSDLVKIARTPAQTWAYEQFDIARDAYRKGLYSESLRYLDRAINGSAGSAGYDLDFRFHFLKGVIHLGSEKNADPAIVALHEAEASFVLASRYSRTDNPQDAARALLCAGRAALCSQKLDRALQHTEECLAVAPSPIAEAYFQKAKILCASGNRLDVAATDVVSAIQLDKLYALKISSDGDLVPHERLIMETVDRERALLEQEVIQEAKQIACCLNKRRAAKVYNLAYAEAETDSLTSCTELLTQIQARRSRETYYFLLQEAAKLAKLRDAMSASWARYAVKIRAALSSELKQLGCDQDTLVAKLTKEVDSLADTAHFCLAALAGFTPAAALLIWDHVPTRDGAGQFVVMLVILGSILSFVFWSVFFFIDFKRLVRPYAQTSFRNRFTEYSDAEKEVRGRMLSTHNGLFPKELSEMTLADSVITRIV